MQDNETQAVAQLKSSMDEIDGEHIAELPFSLFERPFNKTTQLLASSARGDAVDGRNRWFEYKFRDPCLVTRVLVQTTGYTDYHEFEFAWCDEVGKEQRAHGRPQGGAFEFAVNDICTRVAFKPPSTWFSNPKIVSVSVEGLERENIAAALDALSDIQATKEDMVAIADKAIARADARIQESLKIDAERAATLKENANLKTQQTRIKNNISDLTGVRDELITKNAAAQSSFDTMSQNLKKGNFEIDRANERLTELKSETQKSDAQLKELRGNINLFPTEIVAFVNQGSKNIKQYLWITLIPVVLIAIMFGILIWGAADLSTIFTKETDYNITAVALSRLPYVAISLAIITASYQIARVFISEMIKINNQRLNLTKISIIAKDVSSAAEAGLNLSDEDIYRLRTELKMRMLGDHLKEYISKDFTTELPQHISAAIDMAASAVNGVSGGERSLELSVDGEGANVKVK